MAFKANAETAKDIAAAVLKFERYIEPPIEVTAIVTELFGVTTALLSLDRAVHDRRNERRAEQISQDQRVLLLSLEYTFKDIQRLFAGLDRPQYRSERESFQGVWRDIQTYFRDESQNSLLTRLGYYKEFLNDMTDIATGAQKIDDQFEDLFDRIERLLHVQEDKLADDLENLALGTPRQRSWERKRPGLHVDALAGASKVQPISRPGFISPISPYRMNEYPFPVAPDVPSSPTTTTTTTASTASSSAAPPTTIDHWLPEVFGQNRPTTPFKTTGTESGCYGTHASGASSKLKIDHDELLVLPFEPNGSLELRLYLRSRDRRARVWCRMDRGRQKSQYVMSITKLRILRRDSCLQLCKADGRGRLSLWANLRYLSYERMVLFYCSFLALKAQDEGEPIKDLDDHILDGEIPVFSGKIIDDNYQHALQIFKDENSGGIRLQASALRGPLKRSPVWTAFINYKIMAKAWNKRVEPRKVHIYDLTRYVFSQEYLPQVGPNGEHELFFLDSNDAKHFMDAIDDLAEGRI